MNNITAQLIVEATNSMFSGKGNGLSLFSDLLLENLWGLKMESVKQKIEKKKDRLTHLVSGGLITRSHANESLKEYAQFVSRYFGCGEKLFNTISATNMLILVASSLVALS